MKINKLKVCSNCGKEFKQFNSLQKFCSYNCSKSKISKGKIKNKKCEHCGFEFHVRPSHLPNTKYCSYKCYGEAQRKREVRTCEICKTSITKPISYFKWSELRGNKHVYCSMKCRNIGISKRDKGKIRSKLWTMRQADNVFSNYIRDRDNWTCRYCNKNFRDKSGQLHNSHFWGRKHYATRFDPENCIALCFTCHLWELEKEKQGIYRRLMVEWIGQDKYDKLEQKHNLLKSKDEAIGDLMVWIKPYLKDLIIPKKRKAFLLTEDGISYLD